MEAAQKAISSPLLEETSIEGARGVIINVTGGEDMSLMEVNEASSIIHQAADDDANIIFGAVVDPSMDGRLKITVIATGFQRAESAKRRRGTVTPVDIKQLRQDPRVVGSLLGIPATGKPREPGRRSGFRNHRSRRRRGSRRPYFLEKATIGTIYP